MVAIERCRELARLTEEPGFTTRTFLSPPVPEVHARVTAWMQAAGCRVRVDAAGNIRGTYPGTDAAAPPLMIGSHLDTVPRAGAFDGILGVILAIALVEALHGRRLAPAIEVIGFSEEEGVRYRVPFIGSRAVMGLLDEPLIQMISPALRDFGLDPRLLPDAEVHALSGFFEIHIEQGPVLESLGLPLGIVDAIVGQSRMTVRFEGSANHAGTTPMRLRRDALSAAAEWIGMVEREARNTSELVATVGSLNVEPGASNVIPGAVTATLDVRHASDSVRSQAVERMLESAREISRRRDVGFRSEFSLEQNAVPMDSEMTRLLEQAVRCAGFPVHRMVSGAGHDAMILAQRFPAAMLFLRSPGGLSHHPDESVLAEDVAAALAVGLRFLEHYA